MEVEYTLDAEDAVAFLRYHKAHGPGRRRPFPWGSTVALGVLAGAFVGVDVWLSGKLTTAAVVYLCATGFFGLLALWMEVFEPRLAAWNIRRTYRRHHKGQLQPNRLALSPDGLHIVSEHTDAFLRWPAIERVAETDDHAFLYTNPVRAIIVPRRVFADGWRFTEFVDLARRYYQQSRAASEQTSANGQ